MKVLLDENLTPKLRLALSPHDVITAVYAGFGSLTNGALLSAAEEAGFEVFLTGDRKLPDLQNMNGRKIAVVTLSAHEWLLIEPHLPNIMQAIDNAVAGTISCVDCGKFSRKRSR